MGDVGALARIELDQSRVLLALVVGGIALGGAGMLLARRWRWSPARVGSAGLAGAFLALVPATTLADRGRPWLGGHRSCLIDTSFSIATPEAALNAALFAPAAFFAVLATRRVVPVVLAVLACSAATEYTQRLTGLGVCESADVARNLMGGAIGALAGLAVLLVGYAATPPARS
jgi:hypothetical protein